MTWRECIHQDQAMPVGLMTAWQRADKDERRTSCRILWWAVLALLLAGVWRG